MCVGLTRPRGPIDGQSAAAFVSADVLAILQLRRECDFAGTGDLDLAIMPSRFYGTLLVLCVLAIARASPLSAGMQQGCIRGCTLNRVSSMLVLLLFMPLITHQWSLLGLGLWPRHDRSNASNQLLEQDASPRGKYLAGREIQDETEISRISS